MRPLIQLEAESRIRLRSSWRGSGGRFEQADGRRSAGPKELRRLPSADHGDGTNPRQPKTTSYIVTVIIKGGGWNLTLMSRGLVVITGLVG